ncbi:hypothetical protein CC78DRAFT_351527 [Lojkania enalia]|uniref:Uncharacterized protein n=1 Tax=Lojkania enalia TaxID=147567 RepID=A0A9P4KIP3_9PLEO|nr:hypothetical protein CC78DRAFT_351527 [Didymosphaeria enalia]
MWNYVPHQRHSSIFASSLSICSSSTLTFTSCCVDFVSRKCGEGEALDSLSMSIFAEREGWLVEGKLGPMWHGGLSFISPSFRYTIILWRGVCPVMLEGIRTDPHSLLPTTSS